MWDRLAVWIIRQPMAMILLLAASLSFAIFRADEVRMSYQFSRLLPVNDSVHIRYEWFKKNFAQVSNTVILAVETTSPEDQRFLDHWLSLADSLRQVSGVAEVITFSNALELKKDVSNAKFQFKPVFEGKPSMSRWVSILNDSLPFYRGIFVNEDGSAVLAYVQIDTQSLYNERIITIIGEIQQMLNTFEASTGLEVKISGIPYLRMGNVAQLKKEIYQFVLLATGVTALLFFLFLRNLKATLISLFVVGTGVIWSLALMSIFDFEITLLTSLIPPLVIVIGIPNCIFLINKFHYEYKNHKNRILALQRTIAKIGNAIFFSNLTTAFGFFALAFTRSSTLVEFGLVASLSILAVFVHSIVIITLYYLYAPAPKERHIKHFDRRWLGGWIRIIQHAVFNKRPLIYGIGAVVILTSIAGMLKMETSGRITDDLNKNSKTYQDLKFIEEKSGGVEPLEIIIDTKKNLSARRLNTIKTLAAIQDSLKAIGIERSMSLAGLSKFATQAYYFGDPAAYRTPTTQESRFMSRFLKGSFDQSNVLMRSLNDESGRFLRIHTLVRDLNTLEMMALRNQIEAILDQVMEDTGFTGFVTGASVLFLEGTRYLVRNLIQSLGIAILLISMLMFYLFRSWKMVLISLVTNFIPLLFTAGFMGFAGIPLKPSTLLVFGIAFGISVDDTIHFLAKYRQDLQKTDWDIPLSIQMAINETGVSMFYTSVILFSGFIIFTFSGFGGTVALGLLVSLTLLVAMLTNLFLLPAFALSLHRILADEDFDNPPIQVVDPDDAPDSELIETSEDNKAGSSDQFGK
ncbi:efflux RND transporter permease subunit [Schleiferia thermophila]|uniref:efflux RND transporter permease subunit n=1 Tax=Schleiferia thermophila TaxID=884107 RepID=UPI003EEFFD6A